jgi:hypothetical protein
LYTSVFDNLEKVKQIVVDKGKTSLLDGINFGFGEFVIFILTCFQKATLAMEKSTGPTMHLYLLNREKVKNGIQLLIDLKDDEDGDDEADGVRQEVRKLGSSFMSVFNEKWSHKFHISDMPYAAALLDPRQRTENFFEQVKFLFFLTLFFKKLKYKNGHKRGRTFIVNHIWPQFKHLLTTKAYKSSSSTISFSTGDPPPQKRLKKAEKLSHQFDIGDLITDSDFFSSAVESSTTATTCSLVCYYFRNSI